MCQNWRQCSPLRLKRLNLMVMMVPAHKGLQLNSFMWMLLCSLLLMLPMSLRLSLLFPTQMQRMQWTCLLLLLRMVLLRMLLLRLPVPFLSSRRCILGGGRERLR